jgi:predicted component of type VI protein secretion system
MEQYNIYKLPFYILDGDFEAISGGTNINDALKKIEPRKILDLFVNIDNGIVKEIITNFEIPVQIENVVNIKGIERFIITEENNMESFSFVSLKKDYSDNNMILSERKYLEDVKEYIKNYNNEKFKKTLNLLLEIGKNKYKNWIDGKEDKGTIFPKI